LRNSTVRSSQKGPFGVLSILEENVMNARAYGANYILNLNFMKNLKRIRRII